jgi:replicative DNA helicase
MKDKVMPHSIDVEESVLGVLLIEPNCVPASINKLSIDFFYSIKHQAIFKCIQSLYDKMVNIDLVTIMQELMVTKEMEKVGQPYDVVKITNKVTGSAHINDWINILQYYYLQRKGIVIGQELFNNSYDTADIQATLNTASSHILNAQENVFRNTEKAVSHFIMSLAKQRDSISSEGQIGINTGYQSLNNVISGWVAPDLIIMAGRPAQGKTAFALNTILSLLKEGKSVGIFSLEMSGEQLINRLLSLHSDIDHTKLRHNNLNEFDRERLMRSEAFLSKTKLYIDDNANLNIRELRSKSTIMKRKYNVDMIVIDYLQLMSGIDKKGNRESEISEISRGCKIIAKELNIPVIALSQLSRAVESRPDKMPQLSDLRESGGIEQDADSVIFIMRPDTYNINEFEYEGTTYNSQGTAIIKVAKNRHGIMKKFPLKFNGNLMQFKEFNTPF